MRHDALAALTERIKSLFPEMSEGQQLLARYILDNMETAAFLTAGRLGAAVGLSESTVVRFALALGYQGWPDLQRAIADVIRARLSTVVRFQAGVTEASEAPNLVMSSDLRNLQQTMNELDSASFMKATNMLAEARQISVLGLRSASCLALWLAFALRMIGKNVRAVPSGLETSYEAVADVVPDDVVLGISFPRYTDETVKAFELAKANGAGTIALTDSSVSPLAQIADVTLGAKTRIGSFVESYVAPLSLLNALVTAVGRRDETMVLQSLERFEETCARHRVYWSPDK